MKTPIIQTVINLLMPLFFLFSLYLLFRGHNEPGGGFIGGLIGAIAFVFHAMVFDSRETIRIFNINPVRLIAVGLSLAVISGLFALVGGDPFMTALWADFYLPVIGRPGTPILFDIGVFILVIGIVLKITFSMSSL
ncbi:MAG: Na+/H+ antiporter subunit B [Bacteroidales bacterium]|jgi:multicomponent Na+:H+ antiporter subunit B